LAIEECLSKYLKQQESGDDAEGLQFVEKKQEDTQELEGVKIRL